MSSDLDWIRTQEERAQRNLRKAATELRRQMEKLLQNLDEGGSDGINTLGEVQSLGAMVDSGCGRLAAIRDIREHLEAGGETPPGAGSRREPRD